jgi:hypothetical protein
MILPALLAVALSPPARANDSSLNFGAHGPEPLDLRDGRESPIRMVEEELTFRFGKWDTRVHARFVFENTSEDSTVRQLSGFPDVTIETDPYYWAGKLDSLQIAEFDQAHRRQSPIRDMKTRLDGKSVASSMRVGFVQETLEAPWGWVAADTFTGRRVCWYIVELVIPPKGRVTLERSYRTFNGYQGAVGAHFQYITLTGGPWQGTIGRLTANVILEDGLTVDDLVWADEERRFWSTETYPPRGLWHVEGPKRMSLTWTDFEPRLDDRRHNLGLAWQSWEPEDRRRWNGEKFSSRWWPWHWFE